MKVDRHSRTAENAAGMRALHTRYEAPQVFSDPYAEKLTNGSWRFFLRWSVLARLVLSPRQPALMATRGQIVSRSRYAEDSLAAAIADGVRQYVIIGAGMDSYALRHAGVEDLVVYEVDHPESQAHKQARLQELGLTPRTAVRYCPVDFEHEGLFDGLSRSGFNPGLPAYFSWLGVTYYLSPEAIAATLKGVASHAAAGSELVFDYAIPEQQRTGGDAKAWATIKKDTARMGEPLISCFSREEIESLVSGNGLAVIEHLDPEEIHRRWFAGRSDGLWSLATGLIRCRV